MVRVVCQQVPGGWNDVSVVGNVDLRCYGLVADMVCGGRAERMGFRRGGVRIELKLSSRGWGRGKVTCMRARLSRLSVWKSSSSG